MKQYKKRSPYKRLSYSSGTKEKVLRTFLKAAKFTASATGTLASFGAGGDTIPDLLFVLMDGAIMTKQISDFTMGSSEAVPYLKRIAAIEWTTPEGVRDEANKIIVDMTVNAQNASLIVDEICGKYNMIVDSLAAVIGGQVAVMIPDDAGFGRLIVEETVSQVIKYANPGGFNSMNKVWNSMPDKAIKTIGDPKELEAMFVSTINYLRKIIPQDKEDASWTDTIKKHGTTVALGLVPFVGPYLALTRIGVDVADVDGIINEQIDLKLLPAIPTFVKLLHKCLTLCFAGTCVLQTCQKSFNILPFLPENGKGELIQLAAQSSGVIDENGNVVFIKGGNKLNQKIALEEQKVKEVATQTAIIAQNAQKLEQEAKIAIAKDPENPSTKAKQQEAQKVATVATQKAKELANKESSVKLLIDKLSIEKAETIKQSAIMKRKNEQSASKSREDTAKKIVKESEIKKNETKQLEQEAKKIIAAKEVVAKKIEQEQEKEGTSELEKVGTRIQKQDAANAITVKKAPSVIKKTKLIATVASRSPRRKRSRSKSPRRKRSRSPRRKRSRSKSPRRKRSRSPRRKRSRSKSPRRKRSRSPRRKRSRSKYYLKK